MEDVAAEALTEQDLEITVLPEDSEDSEEWDEDCEDCDDYDPFEGVEESIESGLSVPDHKRPLSWHRKMRRSIQEAGKAMGIELPDDATARNMLREARVDWVLKELANGVSKRHIMSGLHTHCRVGQPRHARAIYQAASDYFREMMQESTETTRCLLVLQADQLFQEAKAKGDGRLALAIISEKAKLLGAYAPAETRQTQEITIHTVREDDDL